MAVLSSFIGFISGESCQINYFLSRFFYLVSRVANLYNKKKVNIFCFLVSVSSLHSEQLEQIKATSFSPAPELNLPPSIFKYLPNSLNHIVIDFWKNAARIRSPVRAGIPDDPPDRPRWRGRVLLHHPQPLRRGHGQPRGQPGLGAAAPEAVPVPQLRPNATPQNGLVIIVFLKKFTKRDAKKRNRDQLFITRWWCKLPLQRRGAVKSGIYSAVTDRSWEDFVFSLSPPLIFASFLGEKLRWPCQVWKVRKASQERNFCFSLLFLGIIFSGGKKEWRSEEILFSCVISSKIVHFQLPLNRPFPYCEENYNKKSTCWYYLKKITYRLPIPWYN